MRDQTHDLTCVKHGEVFFFFFYFTIFPVLGQTFISLPANLESVNKDLQCCRIVMKTN